MQKIGPQHQAGGDALTTSMVYYKLMEQQLRGNCKLDKSLNVLFGIGKGYKKKDFMKTALPEIDQIHDYNYNNYMHNQYNMINMMWPQYNSFYMPSQMQMFMTQTDYQQ